jgi:predicted transposase YdaD
VIYLVKEEGLVESPYQVTLFGKVIHHFIFDTIRLWTLPSDTLKTPGLEGLLPLMPLTEGGKKQKQLEGMIQGLQQSGKDDLLPIGYVLAALMLDDIWEKDWLKRRFAMIQERLEDSWAYKEIVEKGLLQGLQQGIEQGIEQGKQQGQLTALRSLLLAFVRTHFPELTAIAKAQAEQVQNPDALQALVLKLVGAQSVDEARRILYETETPTDTQVE